MSDNTTDTPKENTAKVNLSDFGIDKDEIIKSIEEFASNRFSSEENVDLFRTITNAWNSKAKVKIWTMFRTTTFRDNVIFPVNDYENFARLAEFYDELWWNFFDDGEMFLVNVKSGFPIRIIRCGDETKVIESNHDRLYFTNLDLYYQYNRKKFVNKLEGWSRSSVDFLPSCYDLEYIHLSFNEFKEIIRREIDNVDECTRKFIEWQKDKKHGKIPIEDEISIDGIFDLSKGERKWESIRYTKDN